jgi:hypothetical protein
LHILFFSWIKTHGDLCLWNCEFSTHYLVELLPVFIFFCIHYLMFIFQIIFLWLMVHVRASLENRRIITLSLSTCDQRLVRIYFIWYLDMGLGFPLLYIFVHIGLHALLCFSLYFGFKLISQGSVLSFLYFCKIPFVISSPSIERTAHAWPGFLYDFFFMCSLVVASTLVLGVFHWLWQFELCSLLLKLFNSKVWMLWYDLFSD